MSVDGQVVSSLNGVTTCPRCRLAEISDKLGDTDATTFKNVIGPTRNKVGAARAFFQILSLSSKGRIEVSQSTGYGEIVIRRGE